MKKEKKKKKKMQLQNVSAVSLSYKQHAQKKVLARGDDGVLKAVAQS